MHTPPVIRRVRSRSKGLRVLVTSTPALEPGPACTPELAAWLVRAGHAVALVDTDHRGVQRQYIALPSPRRRGRGRLGAAA